MTTPPQVEAYHPGLDRAVLVPESSMPQMRQSGWLLATEHAHNQELAAKAAARDSKRRGGQDTAGDKEE
jgi:hypothetical protein